MALSVATMYLLTLTASHDDTVACATVNVAEMADAMCCTFFPLLSMVENFACLKVDVITIVRRMDIKITVEPCVRSAIFVWNVCIRMHRNGLRL